MHTSLLISVSITSFYLGYNSHKFYLRRLYKLTIRIRRIMRGGK